MAQTLYNQLANRMLGILAGTGKCKVAIIDMDVLGVPDVTDTYVSDLPAGSVVGTFQPLTNIVISEGNFAADDVTIPNVANTSNDPQSPNQTEAVLFAYDPNNSGNPSEMELGLLVDGVVFTPNGSGVTIKKNATSGRFFGFSAPSGV